MGAQEAEKKNLRKDPIVKELIREQLYKSLVDREIGKKVERIKVNEAEMRRYYKRNPQLRSSHILIEFRPDATKAQLKKARKRARELLAEVKKSKRPFEELVKLYSDDSLSKSTGGDIGYQNRITVNPNYYEALQKMKVGEIGGPIRSLYGYHIIKLTGKRPFREANRRQIRAAVYDQKRKRLFDAYFKKLKRRYSVTKNSKLLKSVK